VKVLLFIAIYAIAVVFVIRFVAASTKNEMEE
jgi:hypothetical protein